MTCKSQRTGDYTNKLVDRFSGMIYKIAYSFTGRREDAQDVLQEVFLRFLKSDIVFLSLEHEKAWFIRVAINCSKSLLASSWRKRAVLLEEIVGAQADPADTGEVLSAVMSLPAVPRLVVHLYYYEELSVKEISDYTGIKESTVKSHLFRARNTLKTILKGEDIDV